MVVASFVAEAADVSEIEAGPVDSELTMDAITIVALSLVENPTETLPLSVLRAVSGEVVPGRALEVVKVVVEDKVDLEVTG